MGRYQVDLTSFEALALPELDVSSSAGVAAVATGIQGPRLCVIDEIGEPV